MGTEEDPERALRDAGDELEERIEHLSEHLEEAHERLDERREEARRLGEAEDIVGDFRDSDDDAGGDDPSGAVRDAG
jgi:hypothetical protein